MRTSLDHKPSARFSQPPTFMRLPLCPEILDGEAEEADAVVIGMPFDGGASFRPGARFAPRAIREASTLMHGTAVDTEKDLFAEINVRDAGDVGISPFSSEITLEAGADAVAAIAQGGAAPVVIGGDHSISLAVLRGVARVHGPVGLVHFDSHSDTNPPVEGGEHHHGTPFRWAIEEGLIDPRRSVQLGIRGHLSHPGELAWPRSRGVTVITMTELTEMGLEAAMDQVIGKVGDGPVHVSFDIDVVDPAFAPATGTPAPGGLTSREAICLARRIRDLRCVSFDLVEVSPPYDHAEATSLLAASIIFEMISGLSDNAD